MNHARRDTCIVCRWPTRVGSPRRSPRDHPASRRVPTRPSADAPHTRSAKVAARDGLVDTVEPCIEAHPRLSWRATPSKKSDASVPGFELRGPPDEIITASVREWRGRRLHRARRDYTVPVRRGRHARRRQLPFLIGITKRAVTPLQRATPLQVVCACASTCHRIELPAVDVNACTWFP